jgi:hypothetical protein
MIKNGTPEPPLRGAANNGCRPLDSESLDESIHQRNPATTRLVTTRGVIPSIG